MRNSFRYVIMGAAWSTPLMFPDFFERLIDKLLVTHFISKFEQSIFSDLLFIIAVLYALYLFIYSKRIRRYLDWKGIIYSIFLSSYFYLYKYGWFGFNHWDFTSLGIFPSIKYVDFIIGMPALLVLFKVVPPYGVKTRKPDNTYTLLDDSHIDSQKDDELGRKDLAEFVAKHIVNTNSKRSFAIGINAKWGDGKTSFQEMIGEFISSLDTNAIVFTFNPWKSVDEKKIVQDFFELYSDQIKVYSVRLGEKIMSYGRKLLETNKNWLNSLFDFVLANRKNHESQFEEIDKLLIDVNRKIIIFIDDLDRLSTKEIMEVVKLIRNSANFRNTFFVVGYDQDYLNEALRKHNEYGNENYLEKIFQIQFALSQVDKLVIKDKLFNHLLDKLPEFKNELQSVIYPEIAASDVFASFISGIPSSNEYVTRILTNIRDVKRFANTFSLNVRQVGSEIIFYQYFYLSLLKFKYPKLTSEIKFNRYEYIKDEVNGFRHQTLLKESLNPLYNVLNFKKSDKTIIEEILDFIYQKPDSAPDSRSILYVDNFNVYYDNSLSSKGILFGQVSNSLDSSWSDSKRYFEGLVESGKANELAGVLLDIDIYRNIQRFKNATYVWITISNLSTSQDRNLTLWIDQISKNNNKIRELLKGGGHSFFNSLFLPQSTPFFYSTYIIRLILRYYIDNVKEFSFPLTMKELQGISVERLQLFIADCQGFNVLVFNNFYYNCWKGKTNDNRVLILNKASELVREYISQYTLEYLRFVIRPMYTPHIDGKFVFEPFIPQYFESWDNFEAFLKDFASKHVEFVEMVKYFEEYKKSGYKEFYSESLPNWIELDENGNGRFKYFKDQSYNSFILLMKELHG